MSQRPTVSLRDPFTIVDSFSRLPEKAALRSIFTANHDFQPLQAKDYLVDLAPERTNYTYRVKHLDQRLDGKTIIEFFNRRVGYATFDLDTLTALELLKAGQVAVAYQPYLLTIREDRRLNKFSTDLEGRVHGHQGGILIPSTFFHGLLVSTVNTLVSKAEELFSYDPTNYYAAYLEPSLTVPGITRLEFNIWDVIKVIFHKGTVANGRDFSLQVEDAKQVTVGSKTIYLVASNHSYIKEELVDQGIYFFNRLVAQVDQARLTVIYHWVPEVIGRFSFKRQTPTEEYLGSSYMNIFEDLRQVSPAMDKYYRPAKYLASLSERKFNQLRQY